jgi:DNA-binding PadR family transcriptional regulator
MHGSRGRADRRGNPGGRRMRGGRGSGYGGGRHRVRRGDVRSAILALLDDRPMHGYEMIQELEERTAGRWSPSAGSIYPTLQLLEDEGLIKGEEVDDRKVYALTDSGREVVPESSEGKRPWEQGDEGSPRFQLRSELMRTIGAAKQIARVDDEQQLAKGAEILKDARRKLYGILAEE